MHFHAHVDWEDVILREKLGTVSEEDRRSQLLPLLLSFSATESGCGCPRKAASKVPRPESTGLIGSTGLQQWY